jgi:hypothetical protein
MNATKTTKQAGERTHTLRTEERSGRHYVTESTPQRPSWKSHGEGRAVVEITVNHNGSLEIEASEIPDGLLGSKKVYVPLSHDGARELFKALKMRFGN